MRLIKIAQSANAVNLSGTTLTVYHRTKNSDIAGNICSVGFMAGDGAYYGRGIYTTYDLQSSLRNYNLTTYGGQLLRAKINIQGFLIFDYDIAKMVYGSNYRLTDQVKIVGEDKVLNPSRNIKKQWATIEGVSKALNGVKLSSSLARRIATQFNLDSTGLNGIIFTGSNDGRVCLSYKESLVIPEAHAFIDGKTYKNPNWEECDQKSREELEKLQYNEYKSDLFRKDRKRILKDLNTLKSSGTINLMPYNYKGIPERIFDDLIKNFLIEDESRIARLHPKLRQRLSDFLDVEILLRKFKKAPTVYWKEWEKLDESIKSKIPKDSILMIWNDFISKNPGYWGQIPDGIRPLVDKEKEIAYWQKLINKNENNWMHVHPEIGAEIEERSGKSRPNIDEKELETVSSSKEIDVPVNALPWIQEQISKLNLKAGRLGLRPIMHEVIKDNPESRTQTIKILGNIPYIKGWKLIGKISRRIDPESKEEFQAVETLSDEGLPEGIDFSTIDMRCDHCGHNRKRNECYIIKNESVEDDKYEKGQYLIIGSTCLGDFIGAVGKGTSPDSIAKYAQTFQEMIHLFEEGNKYKNKSDDDIRKEFKKNGVPLVFFLSKVLELEKQFGFKSRKDAYQNGVSSTAELAWSMCVNLNIDQKYSQDGVNASDLSEIYSALAWIKTIPAPKDDNDKKANFLYEIQKNCSLGTVFKKGKAGNLGIVSWLPTMYRKYMELKIDNEKLLGNKNDTVYFSGQIKNTIPVLLQISQQVNGNRNTMSNYVVASNDKRKISFIDEGLNLDQNNDIFIKGIVDKPIIYHGETITSLKDVAEITEEEYQRHVPYMESKFKELIKEKIVEEQTEESKAIPQSPQGKYTHGDIIVERFKVLGIYPANYGQKRVVLQDPYGNQLSSFTTIDVGEKGSEVILSGKVDKNGRYTNLRDLQKVDENFEISNPTVVEQYKEGDLVQDAFKILGSRAGNYNSTLYFLEDSLGRKLSGFTTADLGYTGDIVNLSGVISINGQYTNLKRIKVMPKTSQAPTAPVNRPSVNNTPPDSDGGSGGSSDDSKPDINSGSNNWYRFGKTINTLSEAQEDELLKSLK